MPDAFATSCKRCIIKKYVLTADSGTMFIKCKEQLVSASWAHKSNLHHILFYVHMEQMSVSLISWFSSPTPCYQLVVTCSCTQRTVPTVFFIFFSRLCWWVQPHWVTPSPTLCYWSLCLRSHLQYIYLPIIIMVKILYCCSLMHSCVVLVLTGAEANLLLTSFGCDGALLDSMQP